MNRLRASSRTLAVFALLSCALAGACQSRAARADIIELKTGQKIEGDVLKDSGGELVVDLGVDIVKIPVSQIKSRQAADAPDKAAPDSKSEKHEIYSTADL